MELSKIIKKIKSELLLKNYQFLSETDTEVIPNLLQEILKENSNIFEAIKILSLKLIGSFVIILLIEKSNKIYFIKNGAPLILGVENEKILASDPYIVNKFTDQLIYLKDGDIGYISDSETKIYNQNSQKIETREAKKVELTEQSFSKGDYDHFMIKEIYEQPQVLLECINQYFNLNSFKIKLPIIKQIAKYNIEDITIIGCGTSYFSASLAKYWFEEFLGIKIEVAIASEYRYRKIPFKSNGIVIGISQSGETKDTLAALELAKENSQYVIAIVNVIGSSMGEVADIVLPIFAGQEIGVASTKAFTCQITTLFALICAIAEETNIKIDYKFLSLLQNISKQVLEQDPLIQLIANKIAQSRSILFTGRNYLVPIAYEGALKLKELSYIHAEGIAAGELKHGSIALIDDSLITICFAFSTDELFLKTASNLEEIYARKGKIILIGDKKAYNKLKNILYDKIILENCNDQFTKSISSAIVAQLLACRTALVKGYNIDQPRNLAKSVTVE